MKDEIVSLAKKFIETPSIIGGAKEADEILDIVKRQLADHQPAEFVFYNHPSLIYNNKAKDLKEFKIILNGHLDTQPGTAEQFKPFEKDGKLYGRGAYDMKAATAVMILLFKEIANKVHFPLALQLTTDEETDISTNTNITNGTGHQVNHGIRGEFVIVGECNSNLRVTNQAKGRKLIKISVNGKKSHSAYPWRGENAIWAMHEILEPIMQAFPLAKNETFNTTVNITKIESNNPSTVIIPDSCNAWLDVRFNPEDADTIIPKITSLIPKNIKVEVHDIRPAHHVDPDNAYITLLKKSTTNIHGKDLPLRFAHGASDATFFTAVGCNAVEFGPIGDGAHDDEEWVDIRSLEEYYNILKEFLLAVDSQH